MTRTRRLSSFYVVPGQDLVPEPARQRAEAGEEVRQANRRGEVQRGHESAARGRGRRRRRGNVRNAASLCGGCDGAHAAPLALVALIWEGKIMDWAGRGDESSET